MAMFLISAAVLTVLYHWATQSGRNPFPWWPDSFVTGASVAVVFTPIVRRFRMDAKAASHFRQLRV